MTTDLCLLAKKYKCDKCNDVGGTWMTHTYTPGYHSLLNSLRAEQLVFLEIGIGNMKLMDGYVPNYTPGASLRMWRDYFPNSQIFGCDILKEVLFSDERIMTFHVDQSSQESLYNLYKKIYGVTGDSYIDIILDDGSHIKEHQAISFTHLWQFVRPNGGRYIIEDVNKNDLDYFEKLPRELGFQDAKCIYVYRGLAGEGDNFIAFQKM